MHKKDTQIIFFILLTSMNLIALTSLRYRSILP